MSARLKTLSFNSGRQTAAVAFYNALGANLVAKKVSVGSESFQGRLNDLEIVIYGIPKNEVALTPQFTMSFLVDQLQTVMERLRALPDAHVLMDVENMPHGKMAIVKDPDGHSVELVELWPVT